MKAQTDMLDLQRLVWKSRENTVRKLLFAVNVKRAAKGVVDEWKQTLKADPLNLPCLLPPLLLLFRCVGGVWSDFSLWQFKNRE